MYQNYQYEVEPKDPLTAGTGDDPVGGRFLRLNHPYFPLLSRFSPCKNAVGCATIKCMNLKPGSGCRPALTNLPHFLYSMDLLFC